MSKRTYWKTPCCSQRWKITNTGFKLGPAQPVEPRQDRRSEPNPETFTRIADFDWEAQGSSESYLRGSSEALFDDVDSRPASKKRKTRASSSTYQPSAVPQKLDLDLGIGTLWVMWPARVTDDLHIKYTTEQVQLFLDYMMEAGVKLEGQRRSYMKKHAWIVQAMCTKRKLQRILPAGKKERVPGSFHFSRIWLPWNMEHMPRYADLLVM